MSDREIWRLEGVAMAELFRTKALSPVEVADSVLARIAAVEPQVNAFVALDEEGARRSARESERRWQDGRPAGPLDGVPVSIKDALNVAGLPTYWGSRLFEGYVPEQDELPVERLRRAGLVILGKTNVPEFTLRGYTKNEVFGATRNPWDTSRTPGGSSGGSAAAVAAGFGPLSLGVDAGGSVRRPAGFTNLIGHKPSAHRVPRLRGLPVIVAEFESVGPMARTPADAAALFNLIAEPDMRDRNSWAFRGWRPSPDLRNDPLPQRILLIDQFRGSPVDAETRESVHAAMRRLEAAGHSVEVGEAPFDTLAFGQSFPAVSRVGLAWAFAEMDWRQKAGAEYHPAIESGLAIRAVDYAEALHRIRMFQVQLAEVFQGVDLIVTPSSAAQPWPVEENAPATINGIEVDGGAHSIFTGFANVSGYPAMSIPCDPSQDGLPIGFHVVARFGEDALLFELAAQYERLCPWAQNWPEI